MKPSSKKIAPQADFQIWNRNSLSRKVKLLLFFYMCVTAIYSTYAFVDLYLHKHFYSIVPLGVAAQLEGGFVYSSKLAGKPFWGISDSKGNPIVSMVTALQTHENIIYGQRDLGIAGHEYVYFICINGYDCSDTQNYGDVVLNKELEKKGLPAFNAAQAHTREGLLLKAWLKELITCSQLWRGMIWT